MLAIYSEIDYLSNLNAIGVYPDIFATDIMMFRNSTVGLDKDSVVVIIVGMGGVVDRYKTLELIDSMLSRKKSGYIKDVFILSCVQFFRYPRYYKYANQLDKALLLGTEIKKSGGFVNIFQGLSDRMENGAVYLNDFDEGNVDKLEDEYKKAVLADDKYKELIRKPRVKRA